MQPAMLSVNTRPETPKGGLRPRELMRIMGVCCRNRAALALGLLFTVLFACFHTISIGGAFPVFKLLLEQEGLHGWIDRTVAGARLGVELAPLSDPEAATLRIARIAEHGPLSAQGVHLFDVFCGANGKSAGVFLGEVARAAAGSSVTVEVRAANGFAEESTRILSVPVGELELQMRMLQRVGALIPSDRKSVV